MNDGQKREIDMLYIRDEMITAIVQVAEKHISQEDLWNFYKYTKHNGVEGKLDDLINKFY